jgi:hypothetical protein
MESRGKAKPGVHYSLEDLPFSYTLWHRPRPSNPNHFDRYLYGHLGRKAFLSLNRFFLHFLHFMQNNSAKKKIALGLNTANVDSESTPDVYRDLIGKASSTRGTKLYLSHSHQTGERSKNSF